MKTNFTKQFVILLTCAAGLYFTGKNLIEISSIRTLTDAANVMVFFTCFFPFLITALVLIRKSLRFLIKFSAN